MLLVCVLGHCRSQGSGVSQTLLTFLVCRTFCLDFFFFLEYLVCIISHSAVWKNCGEACRKPWVCYLSPRKWFFKKLLERVDLKARQLWLDSQAPHWLCALGPLSPILCSCWERNVLQTIMTKLSVPQIGVGSSSDFTWVHTCVH